MNKSLEESKAVVNPSYNRDLSAKDRFRDFLGAYHIILNGVVKHDPFTLENEGQPGIRCDNEDKQDMIRFVEILIADSLAQYKREIREKIKKMKVPSYPAEGPQAGEMTDMARIGYQDAISDALKEL